MFCPLHYHYYTSPSPLTSICVSVPWTPYHESAKPNIGRKSGEGGRYVVQDDEQLTPREVVESLGEGVHIFKMPCLRSIITVFGGVHCVGKSFIKNRRRNSEQRSRTRLRTTQQQYRGFLRFKFYNPGGIFIK